MKLFLIISFILAGQLCKAQDGANTPKYHDYLKGADGIPMKMGQDGRTNVFAIKLTYENGHLIQPVIFSYNSNDIFKNFIESHLSDLDTLPWNKFIPAIKSMKRYSVWWLHVYASADYERTLHPFSPTELFNDMQAAFNVVSKDNEVTFIAPPYLVQMFSFH
ncbi:hypothetical protein SAMN05444266_106335 [Chitinophaga jiangningensis]|uniref:Uncharacterized protein n=1 Tax=Chitinophaga jiangningensis TaxID=1419482 RepID=A0A1M7FZE8_9BACT|nr:hypothetical protein [Chitinophaga jiangningensis]SHM09275.1 hypothetical protein SAMN05444266_106335 [Chitinophaga jiangningensis]